eukprot:5312660-Amphidinium_carterae.3
MDVEEGEALELGAPAPAHQEFEAVCLTQEHWRWSEWFIISPSRNILPNVFATHIELCGFKQRGLMIMEAQEKYERALEAQWRETSQLMAKSFLKQECLAFRHEDKCLEYMTLLGIGSRDCQMIRHGQTDAAQGKPRKRPESRIWTGLPLGDSISTRRHSGVERDAHRWMSCSTLQTFHGRAVLRELGRKS